MTGIKEDLKHFDTDSRHIPLVTKHSWSQSIVIHLGVTVMIFPHCQFLDLLFFLLSPWVLGRDSEINQINFTPGKADWTF